MTGPVTVVSDGPIGGILRFDLPGIGVAGVGASQPARDAIFPVRRQEGGISTAAAIHAKPLGELTISTHGRGELVTGPVTVVSDGPIGGILRFDLPGIGVAGVGASQPARDAIFPVRRQEGGISTAAAIHAMLSLPAFQGGPGGTPSDRQPRVLAVRNLTVANVDSMGLVVLRWGQRLMLHPQLLTITRKPAGCC